MDQINAVGDEFRWNKSLDINASIDAKKLVDMNDFYIVGLALIPVLSKGKRSGYGTPRSSELLNGIDNDQKAQALIHEFKTKIISILLRETSAINGFKISTAELTKKLPRKRFKDLSNMDNIRYIIDELSVVRLLSAADPVDKKAKNRRYCKVITRNQLSTLGLTDEEMKKIKGIFVKYGLLHVVEKWGLGWGPSEVAFMGRIRDI